MRMVDLEVENKYGIDGTNLPPYRYTGNLSGGLLSIVVSIPMTAEEKIKEAQYFLSRLPDLPVDVVRFEASAFLSASRSIFYHLLDDYAKKFGLGEIERLHAGTFEDTAKKQNNERALVFVKWYRNAEKSIEEDPECGFLSYLRDLSIHRETPKVAYRLEQRMEQEIPAEAAVEIPIAPPPLRHPVKITAPIRKGSEVIGTLEAEQTATPFFDMFPTFDLIKSCTMFLGAVRRPSFFRGGDLGAGVVI
jgi:hypothetical protein